MQNLNLRGQLDAVRAGHRVDLTRLNAGVQSPTLAGITGGLSGFNTGLSIGGGVTDTWNEYQDWRQRQDRPPGQNGGQADPGAKI